MCGRFFLDVDFENVLEHYFGGMAGYPAIEYEPREIFPSNVIPVVHRGKTEERTMHLMKWGFAPVFMKRLLINARAETVAQKNLFREAFVRRRCLIPASGYYEWEVAGQAGTKQDKVKKKITVEGQPVISFAGIYDRFQDKEGKSFWAAAILTKASDGAVRDVHDRMPLILTREQESVWIAQHANAEMELHEILNSQIANLLVEDADELP